MAREPPHATLLKIRNSLKAKGLTGVKQLISLFKEFDTNADDRLDHHEVSWLLKQNGHMLSEAEFDALFRYFDKNGDGHISANELIKGIRGDLPAIRQSAVNEVWMKLTKGDEIAVKDLESIYKSKNVSESFADVMEIMDHNHNDKICFHEFVDYYNNISPSFAND